MTKDELQKVRDALRYQIMLSMFLLGENEEKINERIKTDTDIAALDKALTAPEQKPEAWQERQIIGEKDGVYKWGPWYSCGYNSEQVEKASINATQYEWRPLYTTSVPTTTTPEVHIIPLDEGYQVRLSIGSQTFDISTLQDDPADAWYLAKQLRAALKEIK